MQDLNYISQEITKGKNLESNLIKYSTGMSSMYNTLAYIKLSMNYYTVYDMQRDGICQDSVYLEKLGVFHELVSGLIEGSDEKLTEAVNVLRNDVISVMEVVTNYVDRLRVYEYVINRIEYRFRDDETDEEYYNTYLTNDLMHYILSDRDNVVIHSKISEVVEQLPMRLSRAKFYEYMREAFTLYRGAQKGTVDDFVYALRTSAMQAVPEGFETMFPEMYDIDKTLSNADYNNIDNEEFKRLSDVMHIGAEKMSACADAFVLLAQLINDVYTILLTNENALDNVAETENAKTIISAVLEAYKSDADIPEEILEKFVEFEGKQERILMSVSQADAAIDSSILQYGQQLEAQKLTDVYNKLSDVVKLQSGSDFVGLENDAEKLQIADDLYVEKACEELISELDTSFKKMSMPVRRAVMSTVLAQLPVFFNNTEEIQQYINVSLMQCSDSAEKAAVIEILKMIMADDN